jgi:hypothetical protein
MVEVIRIERRAPWPEAKDDEPWLYVEPFDNSGKFYGSGWARKPGGEGIFYASLPEADVSLDRALAAAQEWAQKHNVPVIYLRTAPADA